jgi:hypothetical protein
MGAFEKKGSRTNRKGKGYVVEKSTVCGQDNPEQTSL